MAFIVWIGNVMFSDISSRPTARIEMEGGAVRSYRRHTVARVEKELQENICCHA
jgi:hypothetical protein